MTIQERLDEIRASIENENVSYSELTELQNYADEIDPSDTVLLEAAGVPEHIEGDRNTNRHIRQGHDVAVLWTLYATSNISTDFTVNMKPDFVDDADGIPEVYCRTCEVDGLKWTDDMEWV